MKIHNPRLTKRWLRIVAIIVLRLLPVLFWFPVAAICLVEFAIFPDRYREKKDEPKHKAIMEEDPGLYFRKMGGLGMIHCQICGYSQELTSFIHGFGQNRWSKSGCQCQDCGEFHYIERREHDPVTSEMLTCPCGGKLSRDHALFCPKCRQKKLEYRMEYIT